MKRSVLILMLSCYSCTQVGPELTSNKVHCSLQTKVHREVKNEIGYVQYHSTWDKYSIKVVPEGTYDTVILGLVCNLPDELKKENLKVMFSGTYYELAEKVPTSFVGHEYYELNVKAYKIMPSH